MGSLRVAAGPVTVDLIDDDRICGHVREKGSFEPDTLKVWAEMCKPGSEVLDVGSYSGLFAIAAAKLGARPVAIEPMPVMVERIKANAEMNGVHVHVIAGAANERDGEVRLGFNEGVHLTAGASLSRKSGGAHLVRGLRIDGLKLENLSAVKIDVERQEMNVLRGARHTLARHKPHLIIEALTDAARKAVKERLSAYRAVAFLDGRNLILQPK